MHSCRLELAHAVVFPWKCTVVTLAFLKKNFVKQISTMISARGSHFWSMPLEWRMGWFTPSQQGKTSLFFPLHLRPMFCICLVVFEVQCASDVVSCNRPFTSCAGRGDGLGTLVSILNFFCGCLSVYTWSGPLMTYSAYHSKSVVHLVVPWRQLHQFLLSHTSIPFADVSSTNYYCFKQPVIYIQAEHIW